MGFRFVDNADTGARKPRFRFVDEPAAEFADPTWDQRAGGLGLSLAQTAVTLPETFVNAARWGLDSIGKGDTEFASVFDRASNQFAETQDILQGWKPDVIQQQEGQHLLFDQKGEFDPQMPNLTQLTNIPAQSLSYFLSGAGVMKAAQPLAAAGKSVPAMLGMAPTMATQIAGQEFSDTKRAATEEMVKMGVDPAQIEALSSEAGQEAAKLTFGTSLATSAFGLGGAGKMSGSLPTRVVKGGTFDAPFEAIEEGGQQLAQQLAMQGVTGQDINPQQLANAAALGAIAQGPHGMAMAGIQGNAPVQKPAPEPEPEPTQPIHEGTIGEYQADFDEYRNILAANGITEEADPRAPALINMIKKRIEREAGRYPNQTLADSEILREDIDSGEVHPSQTPHAGLSAVIPPPVIQGQPPTAADAARPAIDPTDTGTEVGRERYSYNTDDAMVVEKYLGVNPYEFGQYAEGTQGKLVKAAREAQAREAERQQLGPMAATQIVPEEEHGQTSPASRPNVPGDRNPNTYGDYENQNMRPMLTEREMGEQQAGPANKRAAQRKSAMVNRLDELRKMRDEVVNSDFYKNMQDQYVTGRLRDVGQKAQWAEINQGLARMDSDITTLENDIYATEATSELGSQAASGIGDRPFRTKDSSGMDEAQMREQADRMENLSREQYAEQEAELERRERRRAKYRHGNRKAEDEYKERQKKSSDKYSGGTFTEEAFMQDDGLYRTDEFGLVLDKNGSPVRFSDNKAAARWILTVGNRQSPNQTYERVNHPGGSGIGIQVTSTRETDNGRTEGDTAIQGGGLQTVDQGPGPKETPKQQQTEPEAARDKVEAGEVEETVQTSGQTQTVEAEAGEGVTSITKDEAFEHKGVKIYPTGRNDGRRWAVQADDNKGTDKYHGDELYMDRQSAIDAAELQSLRSKSRAEAAELIAAEEEREAAIAAEKKNMDGFDHGKTDMQKGKIISVLSKRFNYKGTPISRRDLIRSKIKLGWRTEIVGNKKVLSDGNDLFLGQDVLTKTGLDYADYLSSTAEPEARYDSPKQAVEAGVSFAVDDEANLTPEETQQMAQEAGFNEISQDGQLGDTRQTQPEADTGTEAVGTQEEVTDTGRQDADTADRGSNPDERNIEGHDARTEAEGTENTGSRKEDSGQRADTSEAVTGRDKAQLRRSKKVLEDMIKCVKS